MSKPELQKRLRWLVKAHKRVANSEGERIANARFGNLIKVTHRRLSNA